MTPVQIALMNKSRSNASSTSGCDGVCMKDLEENAVVILTGKFQALLYDVNLVNTESDVKTFKQAEAIVDDALQFVAHDILEGFRAVTPPGHTTLSPGSNELEGFQDVSPPAPVRVVSPPARATPTHERPSSKQAPAKKDCKSSKEAPAKKTRKAKSSIRSKKAAPSRGSCLLPTASDPTDPTFLMSLYSENDAGKVNPVHEVVRRDVLEVRRTMGGKVFFQCKCCKHLPRNERAKLSTIAPSNVETIYRSFVRFMMVHVRSCAHVPAEIKALDAKSLRDNKVTGVKAYFTASALEMGLKNEGSNIVYDP